MDLLRRRNMMQGMGNVSPYPDPWVDDGKVWVYYNVTTTDAATKILGSVTSFSKMSVDGESDINPTTTYTFTSTGEHLIKYTLSNATKLSSGGFDHPFRQLTAMKRLYMPDTVLFIGQNCMYNSTAITYVRFSPNIQTFEQQCFNGASSLVIDDFNFPNLATIGNSAFNGVKIARISNLGTIKTTAQNVFRGNSILTFVELPSTLTSIIELSFYNDRALKQIVCKAITPPSIGTQAFTNVNPNVVYVPAESVDAYKAASGWSAYASKIQAIP